MKTCKICGAASGVDSITCAACGEATWGDVIASEPVPVPEPELELEPEPEPEPELVNLYAPAPKRVRRKVSK